MAAASRISVEVLGDSKSLQAATAKAADALKGLGDVLAKQTDAALGAGDKTVRMNELVGKSFQKVAAAASSSMKDATVSYSKAADEQVGASDRMIKALEAQAVAAQRSADEQVRANDLAAASAQRSADRQAAAALKSEKSFGQANSGMTKMGKTITAGFLGAAAASTYMAVKFQSNTTRLVTQAGATTKQMDELRKGILAMAGAVGYTPDQLANGMYHVVSSMNAVLPAGQKVTDELKVMRIAAEGAQVGHADLEETTYALVSALNALKVPASQFGTVMGQVNAIVGSGDMTMTDFNEALKSGLIPGAKSAGVSLQSLGAAMAVMGDQGMRGSLAGTRLRMSIALLSSPSAAAAKVLETLGLSAQQATSTSGKMADALKKAGLNTTQLGADLRKPDGIMVALQDLKSHLEQSGLTATGAAAVMNKAFGGGRMGATITLLENSIGRLKVKYKQIGDQSNKFGADWKTQQQTLQQQFDDLKGSAAALGTEIGTVLIPIVTSGLKDFEGVVHWFEQGSTAAHSLEIAIGTLATVAIGSYLMSKLASVIKMLREFKLLLSNPLGTIGAATAPGGVGGGIVGGIEKDLEKGSGGFKATLNNVLGKAFTGLGIAGIGVGLSQAVGSAVHGGIGQGIKTAGTDASIGAGIGSMFGPAGIAGGALLGGLVGVFQTFVNEDATKYGREVAEKFTAPLGDDVAKKFTKPIAAALNEAKQATPAKPQGITRFPVVSTQQIAKDAAIAAAAYAQAGTKAGQAFVTAFSHVHDKTTPIFVQDSLSQLQKLPPQARDAAAKTMIDYASSLEAHGELPAGATQKTIQAIEAQFPQLTAYLQSQSLTSAGVVAKAMNMNQAQANWKTALENFRTQYGDWDISQNLTSQNINSNTAKAMADLTQITKTGSRQQREAAQLEIDLLRAHASSTWSAIVSDTDAKTASMSQAIRNNTGNARQRALANFTNIEAGIATAMQSGVISTGKGSALIAKALVANLKAFGDTKLPQAVINAQEWASSAIPNPKSLDSSNLPRGPGNAGGGWIGSPGERGGDSVPIVVGRGEAILNHQQQAIVNSALSATGAGSLNHVFSATSGTRHYMAEGGFAGAPRFFRGGFGGSGGGSGGGTVIDEHTGDMTQGHEPQILSDLYKLSAELGETVYIISGYRSPAHSVAVGGFADDPHTQGLAADIGVGSPSLDSMLGVSAAQLAAVGLWRPFYPADPHEVNHVQLLGVPIHLSGGPVGPGAGGGGGGAAPAPVWKNIKVPMVAGNGTVAAMSQAALKKETDAANAYGQKQVAKLGGVGGGSFSGKLSGPYSKQVYEFMSANGFNKVAIAGMLGNAVQESGLNPNEAGGGMWQQISNFGSGTGGSLLHQMQVMLPQITPFRGALNAAGSPGNAATIFMNDFERPGIPALANRIAGANEAYAAGYAGGGYAGGGVVNMYDATGDGLSSIPSNPGAIASYVDNYGGYRKALRMFPKTPVVSISVTPGSNASADIYDSESGGKSVAETVDAIASGRAKGAYASLGGNMPGIKAGLDARHVARNRYKLWVADWDNSTSIPGGYDAKQYQNTSSAYDSNVAWPGFFDNIAAPRGAGSTSSSGGSKKAKKNPNDSIKLPWALEHRPKPPKVWHKVQWGPTHWGGLPIPQSWGRAYPEITKGTKELDKLLNQNTGDVAKLGDRLNYTGQRDTQKTTEYGTAHPGLDTTTGLFTPAAGGMPVIDHKFVEMQIKELGQQYVMQYRIEHDLRRAARIIPPLILAIKRRLEERKRQIEKLKKKVRHNLERIRHLKHLAAKASHESRITHKGFRDNPARKRESKLLAEADELRWENRQIGGSSLALGSGGILHTLEGDVKGLTTRLGNADSTKIDLIGPSGIGGTLGDAKLSLRDLHDQLGVFSPGALKSALAQAAASAGASDDSGLLALLQQQNTNLGEEVALGQAQTRALISTIPEIPHYKEGGPTTEGLAYLHNQEYVVPREGALVSGGGGSTPVNLTVEHHYHGVAGELQRFVDTRVTHPENVRVVSKQLGYRTSLLRGAPGGGRR